MEVRRGLDEFLLPDDDPLVVAEKQLSRGDPLAELAPPGSKKLMWVHDHKLFYDSHAVPWQEPTLHVKNKGPCPYNVAEEDRKQFKFSVTYMLHGP